MEQAYGLNDIETPVRQTPFGREIACYSIYQPGKAIALRYQHRKKIKPNMTPGTNATEMDLPCATDKIVVGLNPGRAL